jgi:adenosylmethionine-8-amino-7-oxononanoate aminotransferase
VNAERLQGVSSAVFHRRPGETYPVFLRGEGCYLWDEDGKRYLDLSSGLAWAATLGQGRADLADVLRTQASRLTYIHNAWASTDRQEEYAARLTALAPAGINRAMFTSGGSESNELALRITRQYHLARGEPERWKIISLEHSYHGSTIGALSMTGKTNVTDVDLLATDYSPYLIGFPKIAPPISYHGRFRGLGASEIARQAAQLLAARIELEGEETVAGFIVEPVMGAAAMTVPPVEYLSLVREICDEAGILLIADEVLTGAGRTGAFLAVEHFGVTPDLVVMAKGLSGGYASLGSVLIHERVAETIVGAGRRLDHVHTFSGHPIACAVGIAVLDVLERDDLIAGANEKGELLRRLLRESVGDRTYIGDIRGLGLANAVEIVSDPATGEPYPEATNVTGAIWESMLDKGFILPSYRYGSQEFQGDATVFAPPLVVSTEQLREAVDAFATTIEALELD